MADPDDDALDDDADLFRAAIGPVRRLRETAEAPRARKPRAMAAMRAADERAALAESHRAEASALAEAFGANFAYRRDEVSPRILRRLQRGQFAIEDEIDLHLLRERDAEDLLRLFLAQARNAGRHCVRIIHGKGLHSPQGPALKNLVERTLTRRADVLACASAPATLGGTGAALVLLARRKAGPSGLFAP